MAVEESVRKIFSTFEKEVLLELAGQHVEIIENKRTNAVFNKEKQEAWKNIAIEFNAVPGVTPRNSKQLLDCYKNLKKRAIKERARSKIELYKTGGGLPPIITSTNSFVDRLASMGAIREPLQNNVDCDSQYLKEASRNSSTQEITEASICRSTSPVVDIPPPLDQEISILCTEMNSAEPTEIADSNKENSITIRRTKKRKTTSDATAAIFDQATERKKQNKEEYEIKMRFLQEEHDTRIKLLKEKHNLEMQLMQEEHNKKMELLDETLKLKKKLNELAADNPSSLSLHL